MKILYIVTQGDLGGAQKSVLLLARHFGGSIVAGTEKPELFAAAEASNIQTFGLKYLQRSINPVYDFLALIEIYRLIKKIKSDIVHLNSSKAGFIGSIAGRLAGTKVVFTARGFVFNEPHSWPIKRMLVLLEKFASIFRDQIVTVSTADEISAKKYKIISPAKITTIHNAIPQTEFAAKDLARQTLGLPVDKTIIGTVANFYATKGLDVFVQSIAFLEKQLSDNCFFVLIGTGPLEQTLKSQVEKSGLQNLIRFTGQVSDAGRYLKAFDIFVLPSLKEGFPLILLEALQANLPIIATNVGGNAELLGPAGIIIPPNSQALAEAILKLIQEPKTIENLVKEDETRAKVFQLDEMFLLYADIYSKLTKNFSEPES